jgi:hypothetical protein
MLTTMWCEFCNDNFEIDHFEDNAPYGHKVGPEYGPTGLTMWKLRELRRLATSAGEPDDWRAAVLAILNAKIDQGDFE